MTDRLHAPDLEVLRAVNARAFSARLGPGLPGSVLVHGLQEACTRLAALPPGEPWLAKRAFTLAGRGHRRLAGGTVAGSDRTWLEASLVEGPVLLSFSTAFDPEYRFDAAVVAAEWMAHTAVFGG